MLFFVEAIIKVVLNVYREKTEREIPKSPAKPSKVGSKTFLLNMMNDFDTFRVWPKWRRFF